MTADEVLAEIVRRCRTFGVSVLISPDRKVRGNDGTESGGWFCGDSQTLAVATGGSEQGWLGILLHEYSHVTQWVEDTPLWRAYDDGMWHWLAGKRVKNPRAAIRTVQALEEDCERRTIRLIWELDAPVNVENYSRSANAYLHFHNVIADKRKWYRAGTIMQDIPELMAAANPTLDRDFSKTPKPLRLELERLL
jgi:hypothetical protein